MNHIETCRAVLESGVTTLIGWQLIDSEMARVVVDLHDDLSPESAERFRALSWSDKMRYIHLALERAA